MRNLVTSANIANIMAPLARIIHLQTCCLDNVCSNKRGLSMSEDSTTQCVLFPGIFRKPVVAQFDQREGSSDGGALLLKAADRHYGLVAGLASCLRDELRFG